MGRQLQGCKTGWFVGPTDWWLVDLTLPPGQLWAEFSTDLCGDISCLILLPVTWRRRHDDHPLSQCMTLSWTGRQVICWKAGLSSRGTWTSWRTGSTEISWNLMRTNASSSAGDGQIFYIRFGGQWIKYELAVCPGSKDGQQHPGLCYEEQSQ